MLVKNEGGFAPFLIVVIIIGTLVIGGKVWENHQKDKKESCWDCTVEGPCKTQDCSERLVKAENEDCSAGSEKRRDAYNRPVGPCEEIPNYAIETYP